MKPYTYYLAQLIRFKETGTGEHEWIFIKRVDGVRVTNYLRSMGYVVTNREFRVGSHKMWYVGVLKKDI